MADKQVNNQWGGGSAPTPPWAQDNNRIDINLIAMLLWQSLLVGTGVAISHLNWYLPDAGPGEMGLQYGLVAFGFLCISMVLFHVGGIRDHLSMRAEFSAESRYEKWIRGQHRLQQRRQQKLGAWSGQQQQFQPPDQAQVFGYNPYEQQQPRENGDEQQQQQQQNDNSDNSPPNDDN